MVKCAKIVPKFKFSTCKNAKKRRFSIDFSTKNRRFGWGDGTWSLTTHAKPFINKAFLSFSQYWPKKTKSKIAVFPACRQGFFFSPGERSLIAFSCNYAVAVEYDALDVLIQAFFQNARRGRSRRNLSISTLLAIASVTARVAILNIIITIYNLLSILCLI